MPEFQYQKRIKKTQDYMELNKIDVILITNLRNLYWLSGTAQYGNVLIFLDKDPVLFIRRNYERALKETHLKEVYQLHKTSEIAKYLSKQIIFSSDTNMGTEFGSLPVSYYNYFNKLMKGAIKTDVGDALRKLRMIKDEAEIELHRIAAKVAEKTQLIIPEVIKPGITEAEIAAHMAYEGKKCGAVHYSNYYSWFAENWFIVASGENLWTPSTFPVLTGGGFSPAIPFGQSNRVLKSGDMLVADYGMPVNGYHADHARSYIVDRIPENYKERATYLFEAYRNVLDFLHEGTSTSEIFANMRNELEKHKLGKFFEGDGEYYQGAGHGIGLELDEPPFILEKDLTILRENMVISLEPKIIIPGWGAIQFEDNFIIKKGKPEILTKTPYIFDFEF